VLSETSDVVIVQLPFPSMAEPHPAVARYYEGYEARYRALFPSYYVPEGELWELPLWVAHLAGMLRDIGARPLYVDLSRSPATADACFEALAALTTVDDMLFLSPLAQNFDLALEVSGAALAAGYRTVLGGNMATLAADGSATHVHVGQATPDSLRAIVDGSGGGRTETRARPGRGAEVTSVPDYTIFGAPTGRVPLLRLNASHGCLYACTFCGDAWSRQLRVVQRAALEAEVEQLESFFPGTRTLYVGDKTFGQSVEAVDNLTEALDGHGYELIVQTHVLHVTPALIERMRTLNVRVVEMGFETADDDVLNAARKPGKGIDNYLEKIQMLDRAGIKVVLNILGGLPWERAQSHRMTLEFMRDTHDLVWLYNLYNFVPYPLTPVFPTLRPRIFDWNYRNWREDAPPVFLPYFQSPSDSWQHFLETVDVATTLVGDDVLASASVGDQA